MNCINKVILCFFLAGICGFNSTTTMATDVQYDSEDERFSVKDGVLTVEGWVGKIDADMFKYINTAIITKVVLCEDLKTIKPRTFASFVNLKEIHIPSSVEFDSSRVIGSGDIFNPSVTDLKIKLYKPQMVNFIKYAVDNLKGKEISWEIIDTAVNKKLCKKFKPILVSGWNKYKNAAGYWEDIVYTDLDYEQSVVEDDDSYVASDIAAKYEAPTVDITPMPIEETVKVDTGIAEVSQASPRNKNVSSGIKSRWQFFEDQAKKERDEAARNKVFRKTRKIQ